MKLGPGPGFSGGSKYSVTPVIAFSTYGVEGDDQLTDLSLYESEVGNI